MTKSTIIGIITLGLVLATSTFAYWKSTSILNQAQQYIYQVDLSLYEHRGVVQTNPEDKQQLLNDQIASTDKRFASGKRLEALVGYNRLLEHDPGNTELLLRIGIIYLQEKEYALAQENLTLVYNDKESAFALDGAWFLALLNFTYHNNDQAQTLLQEVVNGRGNYYLDATKLLI